MKKVPMNSEIESFTVTSDQTTWSDVLVPVWTDVLPCLWSLCSSGVKHISKPRVCCVEDSRSSGWDQSL